MNPRLIQIIILQLYSYLYLYLCKALQAHSTSPSIWTFYPAIPSAAQRGTGKILLLRISSQQLARQCVLTTLQMAVVTYSQEWRI